MFFNKGGIAFPKPSQVGRTMIRNLYEDGYPGAPRRPGRDAGGSPLAGDGQPAGTPCQPIVTVHTTAAPWFSPGNQYTLESITLTKLCTEAAPSEPSTPSPQPLKYVPGYITSGFGGEGEGAHCGSDYPIKVGRQYTMRVYKDGAQAWLKSQP